MNITTALQTLGLPASSNLEQALAVYCKRLLTANQVMNLTAITDPAEVYPRHFYDSFSVLPFANAAGKSVIDVGCGAGFPGLPMKLAEPTIRLTLLDSLEKRIRFLQELVDELRLSGVSCLHGRAEELSRTPEHREQYDLAVSRAVASLPMLCEFCLPFVRVGGFFFALKSAHCEEEVASASSAIQRLGGGTPTLVPYTIPGSDLSMCLVRIEKITSTPDSYPRRFAKIQKMPL